MNQEFERLLKIALKDGIITDKEREILLRKAESLEMDMDEAELIIEAAISPMPEKTTPTPTPNEVQKSQAKTDAYDITDDELIIRSNKWVNLCSEKIYKGEFEKFPKIRQNESGSEKYLKMGSNLLNSVLQFSPEVQAASLLINERFKKKTELKNDQIKELAEAYLLILEKRGLNDEYLSIKHFELKEKFEQKLEEYMTKQQKKGFWGKLLDD